MKFCSLLLTIASVGVSLSIALPSHAALIKQTITGKIAITDSQLQFFGRPLPKYTVDKVTGFHTTNYTLTYIFDDSTPIYYFEDFGEEGEDGYISTYLHAAPEEGLKMEVGGRTFFFHTFGRSISTIYGGPAPSQNYYGLRFINNLFDVRLKLFALGDFTFISGAPTFDKWSSAKSLILPSYTRDFQSSAYISVNSFSTPTFVRSPETIPTPALLPGLVAVGIATLRKRKAVKEPAES